MVFIPTPFESLSKNRVQPPSTLSGAGRGDFGCHCGSQSESGTIRLEILLGRSSCREKDPASLRNEGASGKCVLSSAKPLPLLEVLPLASEVSPDNGKLYEQQTFDLSPLCVCDASGRQPASTTLENPGPYG